MQAQTTCPEKFRAYNSQGAAVTTFCVGEKIRFKSCVATTQPDKEYYDTDTSNGLAFPDTAKNVIYAMPGTYTVTQLLNTGLPGNNQFTRTFTVLATPLPTITGFACAANKVNLKITDTNYDYYRINFGDGTERRVLPGKDTTYQYRAAALFTLSVKGFYRNVTCAVENVLVIPALPAPKMPELQSITITQYAAEQGKLALQLTNLQPEYTYLLEQAPAGSNNFREIRQITAGTSPSTVSLTPIDTRTAYQYRLRLTDQCRTETNVVSNILRTQPLRLTPENKAMRLTWLAYPTTEVQSYQIYRAAQLIQTLPATATSWLDNAVACGRLYCYQLVAVLADGRTSVSNDTCQQVNATVPPQPGFLLASYNARNQVELRLQPALYETLQEVSWQKKINNGNFANLGISPQNTFQDTAAFAATEAPCFQAFYTDSCGLTSAASNLVCPVILKGSLNEKEGAVSLTWSDYIGLRGAVQYTLEVLDAATQQLLNTYPAGRGRTYRDAQLSTTSQVLAYRVKVTFLNSTEVSYSNQVRVAQGFSAYIPTAFSPNNDGLNDVFEVKGRFVNAVHLQIYNRWGQVIFESKGTNPSWDGRLNGKAAPTGAYIYSFTAQDLNGQTISRTGSVTLVK